MTEFQCRTCLQISDSKSLFPIEQCILGRKIKDIISLFIPDMITSLLVKDIICYKCFQVMEEFVRFIERCIEVESTLVRINSKIEEYNKVRDHISDLDTARSPNQDLPRNVQMQENRSLLKPKPVEDAPELQDHCYFNAQKIVHTYSVITNKFLEETSLLKQNQTVTPTAIANVIGTESIDSQVTDYSEIILDSEEEINQSETSTSDFNLPILDSLSRYVLLPHDRTISVSQPSQNFAQLLNHLADNNIDVFQYDVHSSVSRNTRRKRLLLFGTQIIRCPDCKAEFENHKELMNHHKSLHDDRFPLTDPLTEMFDTFIRKKKKGPNFNICPVCEKTFVSVIVLRQHLQKIHKDYMPYKCEKCSKVFRMKCNYDKHIEEFKDLDSCNYRKCRICSEMIGNKQFFDHVKFHRNITCEECGRKFATVGFLNAHKIVHQTVKKKEQHLCPICGKLYAKTQQIRLHIKSHEESQSNDKYMCDKCPKIFLTSMRLYHHSKKVHGAKKQYECSECKKICGSMMSLKSHQKLKHGDGGSHICQICGDQFVRGDYFRRHMRRHIIDGVSKVRKRRHLWVYERTKFYSPKCKYCNKTYKNVYFLRQHIIMSHLNNMRYKCRICDFTFANTHNRYRHEKRHKDPNFELSCKICWKRMDTQEDLDLHYKKHKMNRKYKCGQCGILLPSKYHYLNHVTQQHITKEDVEREKKAVLKNGLEEFLYVD